MSPYCDGPPTCTPELVGREKPVTADMTAVLEMYHDVGVSDYRSVRIDARVLDGTAGR